MELKLDSNFERSVSVSLGWEVLYTCELKRREGQEVWKMGTYQVQAITVIKL